MQTAAHDARKSALCNAGSFFDVAFTAMTEELFEQTMLLNVPQHYFLIQTFAKHLISRQRTGKIVVISSTNGFFAESGSTAYDISKGALLMLTKTMALNLAPHGIHVNGIAPGLTRTRLTSWTEREPENVTSIEERIPARRLETPDDYVALRFSPLCKAWET